MVLMQGHPRRATPGAAIGYELRQSTWQRAQASGTCSGTCRGRLRSNSQQVWAGHPAGLMLHLICNQCQAVSNLPRWPRARDVQLVMMLRVTLLLWLHPLAVIIRAILIQ